MSGTGDERRQQADGRLERVIAEVAREEDLRLVVLFGSAARGEARQEDLDLAVRGGASVDLLALTNRLIQRLGRQEMDLVNLRTADPVLMVQVARDGVPLYESEPGEFAQFHSYAYRRFADTKKFRDAERRELQEFIARRGSSG